MVEKGLHVLPDIWVCVLASSQQWVSFKVHSDWACHQQMPHLVCRGLQGIVPCMSMCINLYHSCLTSLMVRDAEVCCKKMLHRPTLYLLSMPSSCLVTCADIV